MMRLQIFIAAAALLSLTVLVGSPVAQAASPAINIAKNAKLGDILTDDRGMTLYVYKNDSPGKSACMGGCAQTWPAFTVDDETNLPTLASGVTGKVAVIGAAGGKYQVTFNDMPLYFYAQDAKTGDTNGQGIGGAWSVLSSGGTPATSSAANKSSGTAKTNTYGKSSTNGSYGMGGYGMYGYGMYGYSYMMPYYYRPYIRIYRPFPYFRMPFYGGMMGMMRRY
jgi:predicted lipoprotein with Yx(FWY)xxD motif